MANLLTPVQGRGGIHLPHRQIRPANPAGEVNRRSLTHSRVPLMKKHHSIIIAILMALVPTAPGQNPARPGASAPPPQGEIGKWLADVEAQWQVDSKLEVSDVYESELGKAKLQYQKSI